MPRPKIKNGKRTMFQLDEETITEIKRCAGLNEMSSSAYLDFLIKRDKLAQNPVAKVKEIQFQKEALQDQVKALELKEKEAVENASNLHEWQESKRTKKPQALEAIKRKILNKEFEGAEEIAKTWQRMTGISAIELIGEATQQIRKSGI